MKLSALTYRILALVLLSVLGMVQVQAQDVRVPDAQRRRQNLPDSLKLEQLTELDSLQLAIIAQTRDSIAHLDSLRLDSIARKNVLATTDTIEIPKVKAPFVPDPKKALWMAIAFPGAGQIYNRKYWKLPIIYGGFLGCFYALTWNNGMYRDYSQAYIDIMDSDPNTKSYMNFIPSTYDVNANIDRLKDIFKRKKDYYRRYRDLSFFCMLGVYGLSIIDAYVDAELSSFDMGEDLTMKVSPSVINDGNNYLSQRGLTGNSYGMKCSLRF